MDRLVGRGKKSCNYQRGQAKAAFFFGLPAIILLSLFVIIPFGMSVFYAFTDKLLIPKAGIETSFTGFTNFVKVFTNKTTFISIKNTFVYALIVVPATLVLGTALAVLVNKQLKGVKLFRLIYFSPQVVTMTVVAVVWSFIFSPRTDGLLNSIIGIVGLEPQRWLQDANKALACIAVMYIWQTLGMQMLIILGGLQYISEDLYEAGEMDGCNTWEKFIYITVPGLKNTLVYVLVSVLINSLKVFTQVYVLTNGGPSDSTSTVVFQLYKAGFINGQIGYSSAISIVFFLLVLGISLLQNKLTKEDEG